MKTKRFLSILLSLVLVLGMLPGMSLTASAAGTTTTITSPATTGTMTITLKIKAAQTITASDVTATYGDTDKAVSASVTEPTTGGGAITYAVKDGSGDYIDVAADGKLTIKKVPPTDGKAYVIVKAAATDDYAETTKEVTVTISKAEATVAAKDQGIMVGGTVPDLSAPVLNTHYSVTGLVGTDALTTAPTLAYQKNGSAATPDNTTAGTYDIVPSGASAGDNYNISYTNGTLTITAKDTQTITAENVTATYGDTDKSVSATTDGNGTISYAVKAGSEDYISVASDGKLTIKKVPADGKAYVTVTASETNTGGTDGNGYAAATKDVTVNISKATVTITAKNQSIYVGGTVPTLSGADFYTASGLVGEDALTTNPTLAYQNNGSAATPDNTTAGTYDIVPSGASAGDNYNISYTNGTLTISEKPTATVTKAPEAKTLTYNGQEQELVTAGTASGGTMQYAIGTQDAATQPYTTSIPVATNAGTYYVWYKAVGDDAHVDSEPDVVTVTIGEEILVKYESNGGSGTMNDQKVEKGVDTALNANTFTRDGYTFKEWNTKADGSGDSYYDKAEVNLNSSLTLYAQWKEIEKHTHHLEKVEAVEPGCETEGNKEYYRCTDESCDKWFEDVTMTSEITDKSSVIIKAKGHKWDNGEVTKEATYDEAGIRTYTCSVCGETKTESIKKKERPSSNDDSDDSDSGSSSSSGSSSKRYTEAQAKVDQINNVSTYGIPENHQVETGVPASDVGGRWGNNANADTWTYTKSDGSLAKSEWLSLDYNGLRYWYYFNDDGNMHTNWFDYKGERFYLMPDKDGWRGRMATGWKNIDNKWYYFDIVPGSSQGRLYRSSVTPDGHTVGADGAWNGVGATPVGQK